ncbi:regulator of rDNA transcription 14 [Scheffersomyces coipomensis]|uniref:regulator of rDNA transcription 14 n=1 Tax=Scheffersomyces coipomensis TaxID=1788519 RepID=UPI00315CE584
MAFKSEASKFQAEAAVNKLLSNIIPSLPTSQKTSRKSQTNKKKINAPTSTQLLANQLDSTTTSINTRKLKKQKQSKIKKQVESDKKFNKFIKYNIITNKSNPSIEEGKYIKKLIKRNINQIKMASEFSNDQVEDEINDIRSSLVETITNKNSKRLRKKRVNGSKEDTLFNDFNDKVKKGFISYPGLTPGLAPIDYNEEDSD